ncbi:hypothetical protein JTB14_015867 [Gonioctena quinquepunctata]|nr:hypothetical protein JTB14_015867 [Gonioctena quinquepunctata]
MFFLSSVMKSLLMILVLAVAVTTFVEMRGTDGDTIWPWHLRQQLRSAITDFSPPIPQMWRTNGGQPPSMPQEQMMRGDGGHPSPQVPMPQKQKGSQRRGHGGMDQRNGKTHWKCHFNPVTCF